MSTPSAPVQAQPIVNITMSDTTSVHAIWAHTVQKIAVICGYALLATTFKDPAFLCLLLFSFIYIAPDLAEPKIHHVVSTVFPS